MKFGNLGIQYILVGKLSRSIRVGGFVDLANLARRFLVVRQLEINGV